MADNGYKINKSLNLNPQATAPNEPVDGDLYFDSTAQTFVYFSNGAWANFDSVGTVTSALSMTSANFTPAKVRNSVIKVTGGVALSNLYGISSSFSGKHITVYNAGTATIVVHHENAGEGTANNKIKTPTAGSMNLVAGEVAVFMYDVAASRWLLVSISSNAGAQVLATNVNPGIVQLDTASGAVGLDANRAVTIAAPTSAVTALTVNANGTANAATFNGPVAISGHTHIRSYTAAGQSIPDVTTTIVVFDTEHFDSLAEHNTATGRATIAAAGYYSIDAAVLFDVVSWPINTYGEIRLYRNGNLVSVGSQYLAQATTTMTVSLQLSDTILVVAGDILDIRLYHNRGIGSPLTAVGANNYFNIHRIV